jgi:hypothetical protein
MVLLPTFHPIVYKIGKKQLEAFFKFDFGKYTKDGRTAVLSQEAKINFTKNKEEMYAQFLT